jgi:hypothetical protein
MADSSVTLYAGDTLTITVSDGQAPEPDAPGPEANPAASFDPLPPGVDPIAAADAPADPAAGSVPSPVAGEGNPPSDPEADPEA